MRIEIVAKNYKPSDRLKEIIEKKLEKFSRFFDNQTVAKVVLKELNKDKDVMEITIHYGSGIMRSEVISDNMYENIDLALPKLERQMRKYKTVLGNRIKAGAFDAGETDSPVEKALEVARVKPTDLRKISVKEAIAEMELLDHAFYAFVNETNGMVNVVYRRAVGDVGLLDLIY